MIADFLEKGFIMKRIELSGTKKDFRFACHYESVNRIVNAMYKVAPGYGFYNFSKDGNNVKKAYFSIPPNTSDHELVIIDSFIDYLLS